MNDEPLNIRTSMRAIWRRRVRVLVVAVLCGLAGVVYGFLAPTKSTAVALVLLPHTTTSSSSVGSSVATGEAIAKSTPVLAAAGSKLSPPLGALEVKKLVSVSEPSGQILQIEAQGATSSDAVRLANGVAASFIHYVTQLDAGYSGPALAALRHQSSQLTQQINSLQAQIDTVSTRLNAEGVGSSAGQQDATLLGQLQNEQNQVSQQLNAVATSLATTQAGVASAAGGTLVLQKATVQPMSRYRLPVEAGIIGFLIGLLGGAISVLIRAQRGSRLQFRDEIARVAGAPILASLEAPGCTTASEWRTLLKGAPRASDEWALRHLRYAVQNGAGPRSAVRVFSFAGDSPALTTGPRLALQAAANGIRTCLAPEDRPELDHRSLAPLRAAFTGGEAVGPELPLTVGGAGDGCAPVQLLVSLVVLDRAPSTLAPSDAVNVLSVSPNFLTADELAQLALAATRHGSTLKGVVVVNPDPADTTSGRWNEEVVRPLSPGSLGGAAAEDPVALDAQDGYGAPGGLLTKGRKG
jgi:capsular polysaccharide biosynthesis protein